MRGFRPSRRPLILGACGAALAVGAAGCGSSDDDAATTLSGYTGPTAATPATDAATTTAGGGTTTPATTTPTLTAATTTAGGTTSMTAGGSSGLPAADPAAGRIDPCSLLDDGDVTGAGGKAGVHDPESNDVGKGCNFGVLLVHVGELYPNFEKLGGTTVAGVGEGAYYRKQFHDLRTRKGGVRVDVQCRLCSGDELPTLRKLASKAIARVP